MTQVVQKIYLVKISTLTHFLLFYQQSFSLLGSKLHRVKIVVKDMTRVIPVLKVFIVLTTISLLKVANDIPPGYMSRLDELSVIAIHRKVQQNTALQQFIFRNIGEDRKIHVQNLIYKLIYILYAYISSCIYIYIYIASYIL